MHFNQADFASMRILLPTLVAVPGREDERLKRIRDEGYDRFAPINESNRPPDSVPSKRPPVSDDDDSD